jgi:hypothetical protein
VTASVLRAHIVSWVLLIAEERGLPLPADNLEAMSRWMLHHTEWLRHHEAGSEAIDEIVGDVDKARKVIDRPPHRTTFPVGPCPETDDQGAACIGEVRAYIPNDEDQPARLSCNTCGAVWLSYQWLRAGRRILARAEQKRYVKLTLDNGTIDLTICA